MITQDELMRRVRYDRRTGKMTWRDGGPGRAAGSDVGSINVRGYRRTTIDGKHYFVHHLAWLYVFGYLPKRLDHRNGVFHDNAIKNLRQATVVQNGRNRALASNNTSGATGVTWIKKISKYRTDIKLPEGRFVLGNFEEIEPAILLRLLAEKFFFGRFMRSNNR